MGISAQLFARYRVSRSFPDSCRIKGLTRIGDTTSHNRTWKWALVEKRDAEEFIAISSNDLEKSKGIAYRWMEDISFCVIFLKRYWRWLKNNCELSGCWDDGIFNKIFITFYVLKWFFFRVYFFIRLPIYLFICLFFFTSVVDFLI